MNKMLVICPTYNRVEICQRMIQSFKDTAGPNTSLIVCLTKGDPRESEYSDMLLKENVRVWFSKEKSITKIYNEIYAIHPNYDFYHLTNDDVIYHIKNWDFVLTYILIQRGGGIIFGNDLMHGKNLCTFPVISRNVIEVVGWLQMPKLEKLWGDHVWMHLGSHAQCLCYHHEMIIEHRHWINGHRENDNPTYKEDYKKDHREFEKWVNQHGPATVEKIRTLFKKEEANAAIQGDFQKPR